MMEIYIYIYIYHIRTSSLKLVKSQGGKGIYLAAFKILYNMSYSFYHLFLIHTATLLCPVILTGLQRDNMLDVYDRLE